MKILPVSSYVRTRAGGLVVRDDGRINARSVKILDRENSLGSLQNLAFHVGTIEASMDVGVCTRGICTATRLGSSERCTGKGLGLGFNDWRATSQFAGARAQIFAGPSRKIWALTRSSLSKLGNFRARPKLRALSVDRLDRNRGNHCQAVPPSKIELQLYIHEEF